MDDVNTGNQVRQFNEQGLPIKTPDGLDFCARNTMNNESIRKVIETAISRPTWGLVKVYGDRLPPNFAFLFHNRQSSHMPAILVQLWSPGSLVVFYEGSHLHNVDAKELKDWGLLALPGEEMIRDGITRNQIEMAEGGLAMMDSRLGFTILKGYVINIGFATENEIQYWAKMEFPDSNEIRAKVEELQRNRVEMNIKFVRN